MLALASQGSSVLLERIQLRSLLSCDPQAEELEIRPLNVLISAIKASPHAHQLVEALADAMNGDRT